MTSLEKRGIPRALGTALAVLALLLAIVLLMLIVMPLFYKEIAQLSEQIPGFTEQLKTRAVPWLNEKFGIALSLDPHSPEVLVQIHLLGAR